MSHTPDLSDLKYAPLPWYVGAQNDGLYIICGTAPSPDNDYPNHTAHREVIAKVYNAGAGHKETERRANLIRAAVNATQGIPTEALEDGVVGELLEAAQRMLPLYKQFVDDCGHDPSAGIDCSEDFAAIDDLEKAIAKATGS